MTPYPAPHFLTKNAVYVATLAFAAAAFSASAMAQDPAIVGEATMVIGLATLVGADGGVRSVERGAAVRVGDRIQTQSGGHVHLRFVDGGRLSIRPSSNLQIEDYSHSQQQPVLGAIKFRLDEGVVRSITGSWGEAARERFRLNTPVAAIGVKGTDFVVKTEDGKTSASVYTGAIALTPLVGACSKSVGPCLNGFEKILSEDMKGQMVELSQRQLTPQLVPLIDLLARNARPTAPAANGDITVARLEKPLTPEDTQNESRAVKALVIDNQAATLTAANSAVAQPGAVPTTPVPPIGVPTPPAIVPVDPVVISPPVVVPPILTLPPVLVVEPQVNQLFWSRYIWVKAVQGDNFTRSLGEALAAADYGKLTSNGDYLLYGPVSSPGATVASPDASASFRLASSTAQFSPRGGKAVEVVNVNDGTLHVDFARATFSTRLGLSNPTVGSEAIIASGTISSGGALQAVNTNAAITGGLSLDGKEAGYAFDKAISTGTLRGVTLWGR